MKKHLFTATVLLCIPLFIHAQADKLLGTWYTEKGTSTVDIMKGNDGTYYGKISWLEEPLENGKPKVDDENPDPKLAKRPIMGLPLVNGFSYDNKKKQWKNQRDHRQPVQVFPPWRGILSRIQEFECDVPIRKQEPSALPEL